MDRSGTGEPKSTEDEAAVARRPLRGAAAAQAGFDYQLDASILAALQLLLISKAATRLVLEPANEEDVRWQFGGLCFNLGARSRSRHAVTGRERVRIRSGGAAQFNVMDDATEIV
jgi:hypothetical protein